MKTLLDVIREAHEQYEAMPSWFKVMCERSRKARQYTESRERLDTCNHCGATIRGSGCRSCYP